MYIGADYYPEHVSPDQWEKDASLMEQAGFNVTRLAEFAWRHGIVGEEHRRAEFHCCPGSYFAMAGIRGAPTILRWSRSATSASL